MWWRVAVRYRALGTDARQGVVEFAESQREKIEGLSPPLPLSTLTPAADSSTSFFAVPQDARWKGVAGVGEEGEGRGRGRGAENDVF